MSKSCKLGFNAGLLTDNLCKNLTVRNLLTVSVINENTLADGNNHSSLALYMAKLKGQKADILPETEIGVDFISFSLQGDPGKVLVSAFTGTYIGGERLRLDAYRRLAALENEDQVREFAAELADRFGPLPPEAENLIAYTYLRIAVARSGYRNLFVHDGKVTLNNPGGTIYRDQNGKQPVVDYRDPPLLRLKILTDIVRKAGEQ